MRFWSNKTSNRLNRAESHVHSPISHFCYLGAAVRPFKLCRNTSTQIILVKYMSRYPTVCFQWSRPTQKKPENFRERKLHGVLVLEPSLKENFVRKFLLMRVTINRTKVHVRLYCTNSFAGITLSFIYPFVGIKLNSLPSVNLSYMYYIRVWQKNLLKKMKIQEKIHPCHPLQDILLKSPVPFSHTSWTFSYQKFATKLFYYFINFHAHLVL